MTRNYRVHGGLLIGGCMLLTGCMGPTYGTNKTAGEQLVDDITSMASISPDNTDARKIKYQPRGALVVPKGEAGLVTPQESVANKEGGRWLENPEETRERLREEATINQNNPNYRSPLVSQHTTGRQLSAAEQQKAYRDARTLQQGTYSDKRRYLSDPPLDYRRLPEEAQADLGEPEKDKERRRAKAARVEGTGSKWWPF